MGENFGLCRIHEFEANRIRLIVMAEAGFNPQHILNFMAINVQREEEFWREKEAPPEFLRNHPSVCRPASMGECRLTAFVGRKCLASLQNFCLKPAKSLKSREDLSSENQLTGTRSAKRSCGDAICGFSHFR